MKITDLRWRIITLLSKQPQSPLQLAGHLDTSVANISQQLRLLSALSVVSTHKTRNHTRGKPRTMYALAKEEAIIQAYGNGIALDATFPLDTHKRTMLRIWNEIPPEKQQEFERTFLALEKMISPQDTLLFSQEGFALVGKKTPKSENTLVSAYNTKNFPKKKYKGKDIIVDGLGLFS